MGKQEAGRKEYPADKQGSGSECWDPFSEIKPCGNGHRSLWVVVGFQALLVIVHLDACRNSTRNHVEIKMTMTMTAIIVLLETP